MNQKKIYEREVLAETEDGKVTIGEKLSLEHCRKVLNTDGNNYSDEEILEIRDFIYAMATIDYMFYTKEVLNKTPEQKIESLEKQIKESNDPEKVKQLEEEIIKFRMIQNPSAYPKEFEAYKRKVFQEIESERRKY